MQDLKVALVQANQLWEDKQGNFDNYTHLLEKCDDVDLIVLPEMFHTGFSMNAQELAEPMNNSLGIDWLKSIAKKKNAAIYTSLIIEENNQFYNRGAFVTPKGDVISYDKRKSFGLGGEDRIFTAGTAATIVEYKGWKFNLQICYDLRFPEICRNTIDSNHSVDYDVILYVANWPEKRRLHWQTLLTARAIENQSYVVGVNRVGEDGKGLPYAGDSCMVDALGNKEMLTTFQQEIKTVILSLKELKQIRNDLPFLKDRVLNN